MSKKTIEPKVYEDWVLYDALERCVISAHNELAQEERRQKKRMFGVFGEWKKENPTHSLAKMNYPNDEYIMVISAYKNYFDKKYCAKEELL